MDEGADDERGFLAEQPVKILRNARISAEKPHYSGHRQRLRERFREAGPAHCRIMKSSNSALRSIPRADTKERAKALLKRFGSLAEVLEHRNS